jgi:hypothetical protein
MEKSFSNTQEMLWMKNNKTFLTSPNNEIYGSTYFGPAVIVGQISGVQNSVSVPYKRLTWLKKSTAEKQNKHVSSDETARFQ